jgi:hypothetical protein
MNTPENTRWYNNISKAYHTSHLIKHTFPEKKSTNIMWYLTPDEELLENAQLYLANQRGYFITCGVS